ncbi:MAG: DUF2079 domain-containing protein [bacterium]
MSGATAAERAVVERLRWRRARRRAVRALDRLGGALGFVWLLLIVTGWLPPAAREGAARAPGLTGVGIAIVAALLLRRSLDPVTPLREVPAVLRLGEWMASRWTTDARFVPVAVLASALVMAATALAHRAQTSSHAFGSSLLLVLQAAVVAAGALPLARLAKRELGDPALVAALAVAYLAYTPLRDVARAGVDPAAFAGPLLLAALVAFRETRWRAGAVAGCAALACDPRAAVIGVMLGGYLLVVLRERRVGAAACAISASWLVCAWWWPLSVLGVPLAPLAAGASVAGLGVGALGAWLALSLPLALLPLLAPLHLLLALPALLVGGAMAPAEGTVLDASWAALASPLLFAAAVFGARKLVEREDLRVLLAFYPSVEQLRRYLAALLVLGAIVFVGWSPVAELRATWLHP